MDLESKTHGNSIFRSNQTNIMYPGKCLWGDVNLKCKLREFTINGTYVQQNCASVVAMM